MTFMIFFQDNRKVSYLVGPSITQSNVISLNLGVPGQIWISFRFKLNTPESQVFVTYNFLPKQSVATSGC